MSDLISKSIKQRINKALESHQAEAIWSTEDGLTSLEIGGDTIDPSDWRELSQKIADEAGVDFYFQNIGLGLARGFVDWNFTTHQKHTAEADCNIDDYGHRFVSGSPEKAPGRPRQKI